MTAVEVRTNTTSVGVFDLDDNLRVIAITNIVITIPKRTNNNISGAPIALNKYAPFRSSVIIYQYNNI
jgi:hypothetical protein